MLKLLMSFFLLSLPVNEKVEVEVRKCNVSELIVSHEDEIMRVDFFNILFFKEENRIQACDYLLKGKKIMMELEPLAKHSEPYPAYLFVDSQLIQKVIIEEKLGKVAVRMKEYKYEKMMEEADSTLVMGEPKQDQSIRNNYNFTYLVGLGILIILLRKIYYRI